MCSQGVLASQQMNVSQSSSDVRNPADLERPQYDANVPNSMICELKASLKSLLAQNDGCTKHPDVLKVIDQLKELNPPKDNCARMLGFLGDFTVLTSPNFPGRIKHEDGPNNLVQYTLGRLSFNIFQPNKLVCTLRSVRNPVARAHMAGKEDRKTFTYPLILDITIHTPDGDLPATLTNEGVCYENTEVNNRLMVTFTGGTLMPADELKTDAEKLKLWAKTFDGAYSKADEERSYIDASMLEHSFHFDIKRSPTGYLDVLYLDDDLRITKGNRGTIVVAERCTEYKASQ